MRSVYSRKQLIEAASLTEMDLQEVSRCRGAHNRLGFAYQLGFARLFNRFPAQQPFEFTRSRAIRQYGYGSLRRPGSCTQRMQPPL
jgi:hypothetical protein